MRCVDVECRNRRSPKRNAIAGVSLKRWLKDKNHFMCDFILNIDFTSVIVLRVILCLKINEILSFFLSMRLQ